MFDIPASGIPRRGELEPFPNSRSPKPVRWPENGKKTSPRGIDPQEKAAALRRSNERARLNTFRIAFGEFDKAHLSQLRTGKAVMNVIAHRVMPTLGDMPLRSITRADANDLLRVLDK